MNRALPISIIVMSASIGACGGTMNQYEKANVEIILAQQLSSGNTEVMYRPMLDSVYYCPGVRIRQDDGREKVSFVRCGIKDKCLVDVVAEKKDQGIWRIVIPSSLEKIDLVFSDGEDRLVK